MQGFMWILVIVITKVQANCRYNCEAYNCPCECYAKKIQCSNKNLTEISLFASNAVYHRADFGGNHISMIRHHQFKHKNMRNLRELQMSANKIREIQDGGFVGLGDLRTLHLSKNFIKYIDRKTWTGLHSLKNLYLKQNLIERINGKCFEAIQDTVELLYLQQNRIRHISSTAFEGMMLLKTLDLSGNRLSQIDGRFLAKTRSLSFLFLDGNPWVCDDVTVCSTMGVLDKSDEIMLLDQFTCHAPEKHKGKSGFEILGKTNCSVVKYPSNIDGSAGNIYPHFLLLFLSLASHFVFYSM